MAGVFHNDFYLQELVNKITKLKQGWILQGKALHKPVMVLALMDVMEHFPEKATPELIPVDADLNEIFNRIWVDLIPGQKVGSFFKPVFHLPHDGFWAVFKGSGLVADKEYSSIKGTMADGLWSRFGESYAALLNLPEVREIVRMAILDTYFPDTARLYWTQHGQAEFIAGEDRLPGVQEPLPNYVRKVQFVHFEGFIRHWKFRKKVLGVYDYTCCITGLRAQKGLVHPLVEACHIEGHARSGNNHPSNGLALSRNLHAAFDAGLISISDDYRVLVTNKPDFKESETLYSLKKLNGQKILLPNKEEYHPHKIYLQNHRVQWDFSKPLKYI